ncbi:MAG: hypothetical protein FWC89_13545 [Defluviitaleaceae bacterium]|nr:hypothetical protein [Defluviitaleaceae bacterium]
MKKIFVGLFITVGMIVFTAGIIAFAVLLVHSVERHDDVRIYIDASDRFTYEEIMSAMEVVQETFDEWFYSRDRLTELRYTGRGDGDNTISISSIYFQRNRHYWGYRGHGWTLVRENPSAPWVVRHGPRPGAMGH